MKRRGLRSLPSLSKSRSMVTLIGGSQSFTKLCLGYYIGERGLEPCPSPQLKAVGVLTSENLYSIDSHSSANLTLVHYNGGVTCLFTADQVRTEFINLSAGLPFSVEIRDGEGHLLIAVVSGDKMGVYDCYSGKMQYYSLPSYCFGGILHCGRLFAVDEGDDCKIVWSGLDITDWQYGIDGSGYLFLDGSLGAVQRLENFGDDVLCVRDYGFTVIRALADCRNFRIAPSQYGIKTGQKVNAGGVDGQKYYYSTSMGLYSFDGTSVKQEYAVGGCLTGVGRVYVPGDGYVYSDCVYSGEECIMRYDTQSGKAVFFAQGCSFPFISDGEMFCIKYGRFFRLTDGNPDNGRIWRSEPIGGCGRKTLKYLYVDSEGTPKVTVVSGGIRREIKGTGRIPVNISGESIYVEISGNAPVRSVVAELEERK